jgi:hypothetical protein
VPLPQLLRRRESLLRLVDPGCLGDFRWVALQRPPLAVAVPVAAPAVAATVPVAAAAEVAAVAVEAVAAPAAVAAEAEAEAEAEDPPLFLRPPQPRGPQAVAAEAGG